MVESNTKSKKVSGTVAKSKVYVRLRPTVRDGSGHDQDGGEVVMKTFDHFDKQSVTLGT